LNSANKAVIVKHCKTTEIGLNLVFKVYKTSTNSSKYLFLFHGHLTTILNLYMNVCVDHNS